MQILQIDSSARPGLHGRDKRGSVTRRLTRHFVQHWLKARPDDQVTYRDLSVHPAGFIDAEWVASAFTPPEQRTPRMEKALEESDRLVDELIAADILIIGAPLYNFGPPAVLKAWIDQVVRIGRTFDFDEKNPDDHYIPMLQDRPREAIILSSRGGHGFGPGGELMHMNHLEPALTTALQFMGFGAPHCIAVEHQETGGDIFRAAVTGAESAVIELVDMLLANTTSPSLAVCR